MADSGLNLRKRQKAPFTPAHSYAAIKGGPCPLFFRIEDFFLAALWQEVMMGITILH